MSPKCSFWRKTADFRRFTPEILEVQAFGGRRRPQIFAQKTEDFRRLGSVTLGASPLARPYRPLISTVLLRDHWQPCASLKLRSAGVRARFCGRFQVVKLPIFRWIPTWEPDWQGIRQSSSKVGKKKTMTMTKISFQKMCYIYGHGPLIIWSWGREERWPWPRFPQERLGTHMSNGIFYRTRQKYSGATFV